MNIPFVLLPPGGGRAALNEAALRRRSRGERLGWGGRLGTSLRALRLSFTPTLALPRQGGGDRGGRIFTRNRLIGRVLALAMQKL